MKTVLCPLRAPARPLCPPRLPGWRPPAGGIARVNVISAIRSIEFPEPVAIVVRADRRPPRAGRRRPAPWTPGQPVHCAAAGDRRTHEYAARINRLAPAAIRLLGLLTLPWFMAGPAFADAGHPACKARLQVHGDGCGRRTRRALRHRSRLLPLPGPAQILIHHARGHASARRACRSEKTTRTITSADR